MTGLLPRRAAVAVGTLALMIAASPLAAQTGDDHRPQQPPGSALPMEPARTLSIDAHSGTWMSLDVSPDGNTLLFDMLGDLYAMPAAGGPARQLTRGLGFDSQPTYAPDGKRIAFVSDRSGADNLWIAKPDGSDARQISFGDDDTVLVSPAWSADGSALFVSRYRSDLNNIELWRYGLDGTRTLLVPIRTDKDQPRSAWRSSLGAAPSPDGKWLYYASRVGGLNYDAQDAWTIVRRDLATGATETIVEAPGGGESYFRPALSPDGGRLFYAVRADGRTALRVRDLATGADRKVTGKIGPDELEAALWLDILPRYAVAPDGKSVLTPYAGAFERVALADGTARPIALDAHMRVDVGASTRQHVRLDTGPVKARLIQAPIASPSGDRLAYSALGGLYVQPTRPGGAPRKLATGPDPVFQPAWSPDGTRLTFVSWSEKAGGAVWTMPADGSAAPVKVTAVPAYYSYPVFTPDGRRIVAVRSAQAARLATIFEYGKLRDAELVTMPAGGGTARSLFAGQIGARPQFVKGSDAIWLLSGKGLLAIDPATGKDRLIGQVKGPGWYFQDGSVPVDDLRISPDGKWLLVNIAQQLFLVATPTDGETVDLTDPAFPHRRITREGVDYLEWGPGDEIDWSAGSDFYRLPLADALPLTASTAPPPETPPAIAMPVSVPRAVPDGSILLEHARVLTMADGDRILDDADILVAGDRIAAIGPAGSLDVPPGTTVRDVSGKTILPGFIDEHDHIGEVRRDVLSTEDWGLRARLAYGVTTSFDPSTLSIDMLAYQDMLDAGMMLGPRLRSTGMAIFSMNRFVSLDEVRWVLARYKDRYGLDNIKEYRTGNRRVRQWMAMAAREKGLQPTTEGALSLKLDLSQIIDGFAGNEHALAAHPLGDDVIGLMTAMRTSYATTLMITNTGPDGADWFVVRRDPAADPKTRRFWPPAAIERKLLERPGRPLSEYRFPLVAGGAAKVAAAGGLVGMGAHGEIPGLGFHWEIEAHAMGGMTPMAILHAATAGSAETIGRLADLGTVEPGKMADLVILDRDPIADIRNTIAIDAVMRGGFLYDGDTLDELWPRQRALAPAWFAVPDRARHWLPAAPAPAAEQRRQ